MTGVQTCALPIFLGFREAASSLVFGSDPSPLYGYNNYAVEGTLLRYSIDANGTALIDRKVVFPDGQGEIIYDNHRLYSSTGGVVDALTNTRIGTIGAGRMCPDSGLNRAFVLSFPITSVIRAYDLTTFAEVGKKELTDYNPIGRLLRWGAKGLAFLTREDQLVFVLTAPGT